METQRSELEADRSPLPSAETKKDKNNIPAPTF